MSITLKYGPTITLKEWNEFNQYLHEIFSDDLGPGRSKTTRENEDSRDTTSAARSLFVSGIALKQVAANLPAGHALASAASQALSDWEDDYCGTPPRPLPTLALAASLAAFASTLEAGDRRAAIQEEAGQLGRRAFAPEVSETAEAA